MFQIDLKSRKAIYEQVMDNFKRLIITGIIKEGEKVPSVRDMAKTLTVNPNTVQKAYRELENQKYIYTVLGQGSFISAPPDRNDQKEVKIIYDRINNDVQELIFRGETKRDVITFIENIDIAVETVSATYIKGGTAIGTD